MQLPFGVPLTVSRRLTGLLVCAHVGGLACLLVAGLSMAWSLSGAMVVLLSLCWRWRQCCGPRRLIRLILLADGTLQGERADGETLVCRVHPSSTVLSGLAVLRLVRPGRRGLVLVLLPDALGAAEFRRLRTWLRWCAASGAAS